MNLSIYGLEGIAVMIIIALVLSSVLIVLSYILSIQKQSIEKLSPYECGFEPFYSSKGYENELGRFDIKYYLVSLLFILFDLEMLYMIPVVYLETNVLKCTGYIIMLIFVLILTIGFVYEYSKKALENV